MSYLQSYLPELAKEIDEAEAAVNETWLIAEDGGDLGDFKAALEQWRDLNLRAARAYADTLPLTVNEAEADRLAVAVREHIRRKGYCLVNAQSLGEIIAVVDNDHHRNLAPAGYVVYTLHELELLVSGHQSGYIVTVADLRLLHEAKRQLRGVILQ